MEILVRRGRRLMALAVAVGLTCLLVACTPMARSNHQRDPSVPPQALGAVGVKVLPAQFDLSERERAYFTRIGYFDGSFYQPLLDIADEVIRANGGTLIPSSVLHDEIKSSHVDHLLVLRPVRYRATSRGGEIMFRALEMEVALYRRGIQAPVWTGRSFLGFDRPIPRWIERNDTRNFMLGVLNGLERDGVITLPRGRAVALQGKGRDLPE